MSSTVAKDSCAAKITGVTYTPPGGSPQDHIDLEVKSYSLTLDKAHSPYVDATLTVVTPEIGAVALMDPTSLTLRCTVTLGKTWVRPTRSPQSRTFDLMVRAVTNDAASGETTISLSSDEALLVIDMYAGNAVDTTYRADQASLRSIVSAALATYGFTLASSPSVDADYTITSNVTNLATNPSVEAATTGWGTVSATGALSLVSTPTPFVGSNCLKETVTASGVGGVYCTGNAPGTIAATPGTTYSASLMVRGTVARTASFKIRFYNSSGVQVGSTTSGSNVTISTTAWKQLTVSAVAPVGTATLYLDAEVASVVSGDIYYWDALLVTADAGLDADGLTAHAYFDRSLAADSHYTYAWTGTANASTSTRTRLDARDPAVLDRQPGAAMWDWLNGLVQTPGYRLFCDEERVWRLVDNSYTVDGAISLTQAINLVQGSDTIDIGQASVDGQGYVQKVQVVYQWIDKTTAANMTAYDFAGTGHGPGIKISINTPYPGPGYAAAALARLQGRVHVLGLTALSDLTVTPGNDVTASLPSLNESGKVANVTWTESDEMTVGTEGLITIPANAWSLAAGAWSAATGSWAAATGTN